MHMLVHHVGCNRQLKERLCYAIHTHLCLVCGTAYEQHASLSVIKVMLSSRYGATKICLVTKVLIDEVVFTANEYTTRSIVAPGNADEKVGRVFKGLTVLTNNMVEAKV